jgi:hypothetical protein
MVTAMLMMRAMLTANELVIRLGIEWEACLQSWTADFCSFGVDESAILIAMVVNSTAQLLSRCIRGPTESIS